MIESSLSLRAMLFIYTLSILFDCSSSLPKYQMHIIRHSQSNIHSIHEYSSSSLLLSNENISPVFFFFFFFAVIVIIFHTNRIIYIHSLSFFLVVVVVVVFIENCYNNDNGRKIEEKFSIIYYVMWSHAFIYRQYSYGFLTMFHWALDYNYVSLNLMRMARDQN